MAITRGEALSEEALGPRIAVRGPRARRRPNTWHAAGYCASSVAFAAASLCWTSLANADILRIDPAATATLTATNNSGFANSEDRGSDVILALTPRVSATGRGARYSFDGIVQGDWKQYVNNTLPNDFVPHARLTTTTTAVERWVYLDAGAQLDQIAANPFSAVSSGGLPSVRLQTTQYRLSPRIDHDFTPAVSLRYRNDNVWTRVRSDDSTVVTRTRTEQRAHSLVFTQQPLPFGYSIEASQEETDFTGTSSSRFELTSARGILTYALDPTLILGAVGGVERSQVATSSSRDSIRGGRVFWRPTERTDLDLRAERRFFNNGWNLAFSHRSPFVAVNLTLAKQPASQPSTLQLSNPGGGELRNLLDAVYRTRFPNPVERAQIVDTAIARLGTSAGVAGPIAIYSDYAQLERSAALSVAFISPLSVLTLRMFALESLQLPRPDASGALLPPSTTDSNQLGGSVTFNRRLTSTLSAEAVVSGTKIEGRGLSQGQSSSSKSALLSAYQGMTPKTRLVAGARRQVSNSNVVRAAQETAAFAGVEHKF